MRAECDCPRGQAPDSLCGIAGWSGGGLDWAPPLLRFLRLPQRLSPRGPLRLVRCAAGNAVAAPSQPELSV